jgi:hypothetical protein
MHVCTYCCEVRWGDVMNCEWILVKNVMNEEKAEEKKESNSNYMAFYSLLFFSTRLKIYILFSITSLFVGSFYVIR